MLPRSLAVLALALGLALLTPAERADACSLPPGGLPPWAERAAEADIVFVGTVADLDRNASYIDEWVDHAARFDVEHVFKGGTVEASIEVGTADSTASCGFPFEEGGRYLVLAE
ncbi:MAG: hypothetical protein F4056_05040, partial [Chloroflexi bacterium]|nr:hypothetical protein [Chloroflexota bacterium]